MKVYELMAALANLLSGADVFCITEMSTPDLEDNEVVCVDEYGDKMYSLVRELRSVTGDGDEVNLYFRGR